MTPAERARRLTRLEAELARALAAQPVDRIDFWRAMPRFLEFGELCAGQRILERYADDCDAALAAGDPAWLALMAAARARQAGIAIPALFSEGA